MTKPIFDHLEINTKDWWDTEVVEISTYSSAISLKRIADALEKIEKHLAPVVTGTEAPLQPGEGRMRPR